MTSYKNPIIPGFNPDPSICYVDGVFYVVTSSFLAFPALPVYASHDLVNWTQISSVVTRNSQMDMSPYRVNIRGESGGVWAPSIRHHNGLFYVIVSCVRQSDDMDWHDTKNFDGFIWTCSDPFTKEWSEPVRFDYHGFDTSLFWDKDGKSYLQGTEGYKSYSMRQISQFEIDLKTGKSLSGPPKFLWDGTGGIFSEAPHTFYKDGYYYLLIAEGGTYMDHSAAMARSRNLWGPYEPCPRNPVLTPPPFDEYVQTIGHADFVEDGNGNWWAVALGTRIEKDNSSPMGRETYLIEGSWPKGEWPRFTQPVKINSTSNRLPKAKPRLERFAKFAHLESKDQFCSTDSKDKRFALHWMHLRNPIMNNYKIMSATSVGLIPSFVCLSAEEGSPTFIARRQTTTRFKASVILEPPGPDTYLVEAGLTVFLDGIRHAEIYLIDNVINFRRTTMGTKGVTADVSPLTRSAPLVEFPRQRGVRCASGAPVKLTVETSVASNEFVFSFDSGEGVTEMGRVKALELSVGFTGTIIGLYATGEDANNPPVVFRDFKYVEPRQSPIANGASGRNRL